MDNVYCLTVSGENRAKTAISVALAQAERGKVLYLSLADPISLIICDMHSLNAERRLHRCENSAVKDRNELYKKFMLEEIENIEVVDCPIATTVRAIDELISAHPCDTVIVDGAIMKDGATAFSDENRPGLNESEMALSRLGEKYHALIVLVT